MPKIRNIIIFLAIGVALISFYFFFMRSSSSSTPDLVSSPVSSPSALVSTDVNSANSNNTVAGEFLNLLLSVKNIKLDDSIFSENTFKSLHDSSIVLTPDGTEGRPNPFAPIGNDVVAPGETPKSSLPAQNPSASSNTSSSINVTPDLTPSAPDTIGPKVQTSTSKKK